MSWPTGLMAAVVFASPGVLEWAPVPIPGPRAGSVLVRIERVGICGTDVDLFDGTMGYYASGLTHFPMRPGHEWCGTVVALGDDVAERSAVRVGDRAVGEPFLSCGRCALCRGGRRDQCQTRDEIGVRGETPGAAAEFFSVPVENVAIVPAGLDASAAVLAEPLVTALHALSVLQLQPGESLGVIGAGTLGMLAAQVARASGAEVVLYARGDRRERAASCGAEFVRVSDAQESRHDAVIEASGGDGSLALALSIARPAGRIALVGVPGPQSVDATSVIIKGLKLTGVLGGIPFLERAVQLLAEGIVTPDTLIEGVFPAEAFPAALADLRAGRTRRPKIVLDFTDAASAASPIAFQEES